MPDVARLSLLDEVKLQAQVILPVLRSELRRREPDRGLDLHRRASDWHEGHGDAGAAIDHAIAAPVAA